MFLLYPHQEILIILHYDRFWEETRHGKENRIHRYLTHTHTHTHPEIITGRLRKAIEKDTMTGLSEDTL